MKLLVPFFVIGVLGVISVGLADAQSSYDINIPTGAADTKSPYFWQSEKDGSTNGIVKVIVGDQVVWKNADTTSHTITSGIPKNGPDGKFDSGLLPQGQMFPFTFSKEGNYPYYCTLYPWMVGTVIVTEGYSIIPKVGKGLGDGLTTFDLEYKFNRLLSVSSVNEDKKSITFEIVGNAKSDNDNLLLRLPAELIDGPFVVWVDGQQISEFNHTKEGNLNILNLELSKSSKMITIIGTHIIPEFGIIAVSVLAVAVLCIVVSTRTLPLQSRGT